MSHKIQGTGRNLVREGEKRTNVEDECRGLMAIEAPLTVKTDFMHFQQTIEDLNERQCERNDHK